MTRISVPDIPVRSISKLRATMELSVIDIIGVFAAVVVITFTVDYLILRLIDMNDRRFHTDNVNNDKE